MCGLFGAVGKYAKDKVLILAMLNRDRGTQSGGFFNGQKIVKEAKDPMVVAATLPPDFFVGPVVAGHTRMPTHGPRDDASSHPFGFGNIIGAHNGVISNHEELNKKHDLQFGVDSQTLLCLLAQHGTSSLKEARGAIALWYWDKSEPLAIRLCRNPQSPLYLSKNCDAIYFSSCEEHLKVILPDVSPTPVEANKLYRISGNEIIGTKDIAVGTPHTPTTYCGIYGDGYYNLLDDDNLSYSIHEHDKITRRYKDGTWSVTHWPGLNPAAQQSLPPRCAAEALFSEEIHPSYRAEFERVLDSLVEIYYCPSCREFFEGDEAVIMPAIADPEHLRWPGEDPGSEEDTGMDEFCPNCSKHCLLDCEYILPEETPVACGCGSRFCRCCIQAAEVLSIVRQFEKLTPTP